METEYINITPQNLQSEHLSCIIRSKTVHPGIEAKKAWLAERLNEGHVFRKLNVKAPVFIEYAPLETSWVPIIGEGYFYIYCLWTGGGYRGKGYGKALMDYCISNAKASGKSGICILGAQKQKAWLTDQSFAKKYGFKAVDTTPSGYELLALSFDGTFPQFTENAKKEQIENEELTVFYDMQCPYVLQSIDAVKTYCEAEGVSVSFNVVDTLKKAKELPCVFNNWAVFYKGKFETVNLLTDMSRLKSIMKK